MAEIITSGEDGGLTPDEQIALAEAAITGSPEKLLQLIADREQAVLNALARSGAPLTDLIRKAQDEYLAFLNVRLTLLQSDALDALKRVMDGREEDNPGSVVSAANSILDRGHFPKRTRQESLSLKIETTDQSALPSVADIMKQAQENPDKLDLVDEWLRAMRTVERVRDKVIEGQTTNGEA